jgi:DNA-binding transcriptional MocR family regulator
MRNLIIDNTFHKFNLRFTIMAALNHNDRVSLLITALKSSVDLKYRLLAKAFAQMIKDGSYAPGEKLPAHRALSGSLGVTTGTVSKAYGELAELGLAVSKIGGGTFVSRVADANGRSDFRVYTEGEDEITDLSRNFAIPTNISDIYKATVETLADNHDTFDELQQYAPELGHLRHREAGASWMSHDNFRASPRQIIPTNGAQHALLCSLMAAVKHGSVIASEKFTYPGLISVCRALGITLVGLEMDDQGLDPASLEAASSRKKISALYCTPTIQNPTTSIMGIERRQDIARICAQNNILLIEDETHACMLQRRPQPIGAFVPDQSIIISSLSKAVMTGLRVGYVHAPERLIQRIGSMVRTTCWMASPSALQLASYWITNGISAQLTRRQLDEIEYRKSLVSPILAEFDVMTHPNSPHFWINVPEPWRAAEIAAQLRKKGCLVAPVEAFSVDPTHTGQFIRAGVSLASANTDQLVRGFQRLSEELTNPTSLSDVS